MADPTQNPDPLTVAVSQRLKAHRENKGLSIYRLAQMADVDQRGLSAIEDGRNTTVETLARLCRALGIPVSLLIREAEERLKDE